MTGPSSNDPSTVTEEQIAWLTRMRALHRWKRLLGVFGCVTGAVLMLLGRFRPETAPAWALPAGLAIVFVSWTLFVWVIYDRWRWVKANPYKPSL